jgi:hypothetical protein
VKQAIFLAAACVAYVLAAWSVRPGFYDCCAAIQYDYVSPPPLLAQGNIQPTSGSGTIGPAGGIVTTRDQPSPQAVIDVPKGSIATSTEVKITPYAPTGGVPGVKLEGNVYCVTAGSSLQPAARVQVSLLVPPAEPFPNAMFRSPSLAGSWASIGGKVDLATYFMLASADGFGCFAVGYPKTTPVGPTLRGELLPVVTAVLIAVVVLAGLPTALRRRYNRP